MLIVFDLDGTLLNIDHRLPLVKTKPKDWAQFDKDIPNDTANEPVAHIYRTYRDGPNRESYDLVFASGRNERTREVTEENLLANGLGGYDHLYMRGMDDYRSDDIVKEEMLREIEFDWGKKPDMVFDDRPRVVNMWKRNGIFVFNVYQGTEDF